MKITIQLSTENAAFEGSFNELETVLLKAVDNVIAVAPLLGHPCGGPSGNYVKSTEAILRDTNGNTVGTVRMEFDE